MLQGTAASRGIGIGRALVIKEKDLSFENKTVENPEKELSRYKKAVEDFCSATEKSAEALKENASQKEADILTGHILMLKDPYMNSEIEKLIQRGSCAEGAVSEICNMFITAFESTGDELTSQRACDVADIKDALLSILLGVREYDLSQIPENTVIVAKDLTPSMTAGINKQNAAAIVTETGGKTSHSAILARALGIPAVLSLQNACELISDGEALIVDGTEGRVIINPGENQLAEYKEKQSLYIREMQSLRQFINRPTATADGLPLILAGNIGSPLEAAAVAENGGEGIGLFRTEFLFMDKAAPPSEEEQLNAYRQAAVTMKGKPVIIRTLDIGGDKNVPCLNLKKEENPFMGFRAVRYCLKNPGLYKTQLRAILRASACGNLKIMVPLVTCIDELRAVKELVEEIKAELTAENIPFDKNIQIGVMTETPAASLIADLLAEEADFFSIGTNDLTGYTMCADRGNSDVSYLYSPFEPAVLRSIEHIIKCAKQARIPVGMCGEAASDPLLIPLLISFGLDEFSVSPSAIPETRRSISKWAKPQADALAKEVMGLKTKQEVLSFLSRTDN